MKAPNAIELKSNDLTACALFGEVGSKVQTEDYTVCFGSAAQSGVVSGPGEYEFSDISLIALEAASSSDGKAELFEVTLEGISALVIMSDPGDLKKESWDLIGDVEMVIVDMSQEYKDLDKLVNKINPFVLIAMGVEDKKKVETELEQTVTAEGASFKFSSKDFQGEDPSVRVLLLK